MRHTLFILPALFLATACATADDPLDGENDDFGDVIAAASPEAKAALALVNDPSVTFEELDIDARLNRRAAKNIIAHRNGADGNVSTSDDNPFGDLDELDGVKYVGPKAMSQLVSYAINQGYLDPFVGLALDAVFSPQPYLSSHNVRVASLIDQAETSLDIAMYSFSDAKISDALEAAAARGVAIRFIFETGNKDRKKTGADLLNSKSGRLEAMGINVRYVNKIMHHKFMIVDGPRDDADTLETATIVTGSANWSFGGATRYDENTLFLTGYPELTVEMQDEFNLLWQHSRDVVVDDSLPYEMSTVDLASLSVAGNNNAAVYFTSANFNITEGSTTFRKTGRNEVSDQLVAAIEGATDSIWVASGHLRSRPVSEALIAKAIANPTMDIRVYLDGQEYISAFYQGKQEDDLDDCLADATTEAQTRKCTDKGYYFGFEVGEITGIPTRYKYYSYRWHYSYAEQMHHKYLIIDGDELWTGSYNLSDNAEHNTMENMFMFRGDEFEALVDSYEDNFLALWDTGRAQGLLADLEDEVATASSVPLVFDSMALTWSEVTALKTLIRNNCSQINSEPFRTEPESHRFCPRLD